LGKRKEEKDYHNLAVMRGFRRIGGIPDKVSIKTEWECSKKHRWFATYASIRQGSGCPHCAGQFPKTCQDFHNLASEKGIYWKGKEVVNNRTKTEWECLEGHVWLDTYTRVRYKKNTCPHCKAKKEYIKAYGGFLRVRNETRIYTFPVGGFAEDRTTVISKLMKVAKEMYPLSEGWYDHTIDVVKFGVLTED
jgi:glutaredoxin